MGETEEQFRIRGAVGGGGGGVVMTFRSRGRGVLGNQNFEGR